MYLIQHAAIGNQCNHINHNKQNSGMERVLIWDGLQIFKIMKHYDNKKNTQNKNCNNLASDKTT